MSKTHYSVARVNKVTRGSMGACQRHNERENMDYKNENVDLSRSELNINFKTCEGMTYAKKFDKMVEDGVISTRGLKKDATLLDEVVLDINTMYFEERGGYDYALKFYTDAYEFIKSIYGEDKIISAVMHADEINIAATAELGRPIYHYHMHAMAIPTVEKEVRYSKANSDPTKAGQIKEVITQVSHSKMWKSEPKLDENGEPVLTKNGKKVLEPSYSLLQDKFFAFMTAAGHKDFERGIKGSTAEHLDNLQFKIKKDSERLAEINANLELSGKYGEKVGELKEGLDSLEGIGKKTFTGKIQLTSEEYDSLRGMAEKGIAIQKELLEQEKVLDSREKIIQDQSWTISSLHQRINGLEKKLGEVKEELEQLKEKTMDYLTALKHFPKEINKFIDDLRDRFNREQQAKRDAEVRRRKARSRDAYER